MFRKLLLLLCFLMSTNVCANFLPKFVSYVDDEADLLSFSFTKRLDYYLHQFYEKNNIRLEIRYLQSLNGQNIDDYSEGLFTGDEDSSRSAVFILSLSDRTFNIALSPDLGGEIDSEQTRYMSDRLVTYISGSKYDLAALYFAQELINALDDGFTASPPPITHKQYQNSQGLIFFLVIFILIFLFGHTIRSPKVIYNNRPLTKNDQSRHLTGRWS